MYVLFSARTASFPGLSQPGQSSDTATRARGWIMASSKTIWTVATLGAALAAAAPAPAAWLFSSSITLGAVVQMSGFLAKTGRYYRDSYQFAVDKINEKGGLTVAGKTYKLALKLLDNKSEPKLGASLHERLLAKDKVIGLLGPYSSGEVLAGAALAEKYQVPMIQAGGASGRIFSRGYKFVFGTLPSDEEHLRSTIEMLNQLTPRAKTVGLVAGDDSFDVDQAADTFDLLKKAGLEVVLNQQYSERIPNFFNILTLVRGKAPDVLFWSGTEDNAVRFIREAKNRNIHPNFLASFTAGVSAAGFRSTLGRDANYIFGTTPWLPSEQLKDRWFGDASQFAAAYEKKFGYAPDYHAAAAVAAVEAHAVAIEMAGTLDPKQVRDAIAKVDFESLYGRVHFGENGQVAIPQTVVQIQDDKLVEVFTDKLIHQPIYPAPGWDKRS
jgi:branched-chain amino acid transport system substrate-binding protein